MPAVPTGVKVARRLVAVAAATALFACRSGVPHQRAEPPVAARYDSNAVYLRVNLLGYLENDSKVAIVFSHRAIDGEFEVVHSANDAAS